ncbi:MAG: lysophospholipid acyltransferase family protein [Burkholderiales bacterium]
MSNIFIKIAHKIYGVYALIVFCLLSLIALVFVTIMPTQALAYRAAQRLARLIFVFCGNPPALHGLEHLRREDNYIIAANHASYIDGVLLFAYLPAQHSFTIKKEVSSFAPLRFFLTRIGMRFVERFDPHQNVKQMRGLIDSHRRDVRLVFFAEGSFRKEPGLLPFRRGAFRVATIAQAPVIPLVIRGSRHVLPSENWLPRPGKLEVTLCEAFMPQGSDRNAAAALEAMVRAAILQKLDEPDCDVT